MNKHTIIVIVASVVIAIAIGWALWNVAASGQIQIQSSNQESFSYFALINGNEISICNPSPFYTSFNNLRISMIYEGENVGELNFPGGTLGANSEITREGKFTTDNFEQVQYLSMHFDGMFMDAIERRIDPRKLIIDTEIQTLILGFIPYSVTNQYLALDFWQSMNDNKSYSC